MTYGCGATGRQICPIVGFWPIFPILLCGENRPSGDQPTAQGLHIRMITISPCGSRRSKGVPSGRGVFLRLLVGELGTPNLPKFSPVANLYTHAECYYTARQIWTKDVWKCAILRMDVVSHRLSSPLPPKSPQTPFWWTFQCKMFVILLYRALRKSHVNGLCPILPC